MPYGVERETTELQKEILKPSIVDVSCFDACAERVVSFGKTIVEGSKSEGKTVVAMTEILAHAAELHIKEAREELQTKVAAVTLVMGGGGSRLSGKLWFSELEDDAPYALAADAAKGTLLTIDVNDLDMPSSALKTVRCVLRVVLEAFAS